MKTSRPIARRISSEDEVDPRAAVVDSVVVKAWRRVQEHWFGATEPYSLAAFRIFFGIYLFAYFATFAPHVDILFSGDGVYVPFLVGDVALPPLGARLLYLALMMATAALVVGFRARSAAGLILALYLYFFFVNLAVKDTAYERLNFLYLAILCFARADAVWSVERSIESKPPPRVPAWPGHLIALQTAFIYFGAGLWKLTNPWWWDTEMLHMTFASPWGTPLGFALSRMGTPLWVYGFAAWSVMLFEVTAPVLLYVRRLQPLAIAFGLAFHLGIWFFLDIPEFMNCVTAYVLFVRPEMVRAIGRRLFAALGRVAVTLSGQ